MSDETETTLMILGGLVFLMVALYLVTKPAPAPAPDITWQQGAQFVAWYYGMG